MTSAPSHASIWVHDVPASNWVRSRMRIPFSAVLMAFLPYRDHTANVCGLDDERGAQYRRRRARDGTARTPRSGTLGVPYDATVHRSRAASFPPGYAGAGDLPTAKPEQVGLSS